jgi:hypothetical protein
LTQKKGKSSKIQEFKYLFLEIEWIHVINSWRFKILIWKRFPFFFYNSWKRSLIIFLIHVNYARDFLLPRKFLFCTYAVVVCLCFFLYIYMSLFRPCCTITTLFFLLLGFSLLNFFIYSCWLSPLNFSDFVILMVQFMGSKNVLSESVSNRENIPVKFEIEDHLEEQHAPLHKRCKVSNLSL